MKIQIDQSRKIEGANKHAVSALSSGKSRSILIPAKDKEILQKMFRDAVKPNIFVYNTFAILNPLSNKNLFKKGKLY